MKQPLLLSMLIGSCLQLFAQPLVIKPGLEPANQYTGKRIIIKIGAKNLQANSIHTVSFYNGLRDTTFDYSAPVLERSDSLDAGFTGVPGLYLFQIDTVNRITSKPRPFAKAVFNRYLLFLHSADDTSTSCKNTDHNLLFSPLSNGVLTDSVSRLLDTLISKTNTDALNRKLDSIYFQHPGNPDEHLCDSLKDKAISVAMIITRSRDILQPWANVTFVIDSLPTGVTQDMLIKRAVDSFANKILDSLPTAIDTTTLSLSQKKAIRTDLSNMTDPTHKHYQLEFSRCFARRVFSIYGHLDINYVCQKYMFYKTENFFKQLVFVMKFPL